MYDCMHMTTTTKRLTILVDANLHRALLKKVGRGNIGRFLADAAKPLLNGTSDLQAGYAAMARDEAREKEALEWSENLLNDSYVAPEACKK
jgi:hypothetical protein